MLSRRKGIEVGPRLKFNPNTTTTTSSSNNKKKLIDNKKKKKKKKSKKDKIGIHDIIPTALFFQQKEQSLKLLLSTIREIMMVNTSSRRLKQFGLYLQVPTNKKLTCFNCQFLTHDDDDDDDRRNDFPPYLLQHDYNDLTYYQSRMTTNSSGTLLTYGICIPNSRLVFAILVFVNAAGSQIPRSITQPPDKPNTISSSSSTALIDSTRSSSSSSISPPPVNDDWLIFEILTRLPVKTLFRFKTVSKRWCSLIEKDQNFIDSHFLNRSKTSLRRLFIVNPVPCLPEIAEQVYDDDHDDNLCRDTWPYNEIYITADLMLLFGDDHKGGGGGGGDTSGTSVVMVDTVREVDSTNYDCVSNPVNGLICLIESSFEYVVRICNISTRELSPWFESSLLSGEKEIDGIRCRRMQYRDAKPNYQFGFDPSTNEHKLVCLWKVTSSDLKRKQLICEVLTIGRQGIHGDNRWRRIEEVPYSLGKDSVYVNGVIYWSSSDLHFGFWNSEYRPIVIVAFDVGREKFRNIIVPDFILDQPPCCFQGGNNNLNSPSYYLHGERVNLLEVCGRLSMLVQMSNRLFKMYIYEEDDYKLKDGIYSSGGSFSSINNGTWSDASTITLPFSLGKEYGFRFCKFVGSDDEIIITLSEEPDCDKEVGKKCVSFYSYNWKKGSWREFEVSGIPSSVPHLCTESYVTSFSESLLPINNDKVLF